MSNYNLKKNKMPGKEQMKAVEISSVRPKELELVGHKIQVFTAPDGMRLDTKNFASVSRGDGFFDVVVGVDSLFVDRGMLDSTVPEVQRWTNFQYGHVTNLANSPDHNTTATVDQALADHMAAVNGTQDVYYLNPGKISSFKHRLNTVVALEKETDALKEGLNEPNIPVAIARAGIPMTAALGLRDEMVVVDAKRLNLKSQDGGIAIGLRLSNGWTLDVLKQILNNRNVVLADPALATFSTHLGFLSFCLANGINLKGFNCLAMVAAQQGLQLGNEVLDEIGLPNSHIVTAGSFPRLTGGEHPYYIQTANGIYAAGDAGDLSDLLLPPGLGYRKVWPDTLTEQQIDKLNQAFPGLKWERFAGQPVTLMLINKLNYGLMRADSKLPHDSLGKVLRID